MFILPPKLCIWCRVALYAGGRGTLNFPQDTVNTIAVIATVSIITVQCFGNITTSNHAWAGNQAAIRLLSLQWVVFVVRGGCHWKSQTWDIP